MSNTSTSGHANLAAAVSLMCASFELAGRVCSYSTNSVTSTSLTGTPRAAPVSSPAAGILRDGRSLASVNRETGLPSSAASSRGSSFHLGAKLPKTTMASATSLSDRCGAWAAGRGLDGAQVAELVSLLEEEHIGSATDVFDCVGHLFVRDCAAVGTADEHAVDACTALFNECFGRAQTKRRRSDGHGGGSGGSGGEGGAGGRARVESRARGRGRDGAPGGFLEQLSWKREFKSHAERFERPYTHAGVPPGVSLCIEQRPYGPDGFASTVWDSSIVLARAAEAWAVRGLRCIELGAGCGLVGLALAVLGARVTLTDTPDNLPLLQANVAHAAHALDALPVRVWPVLAPSLTNTSALPCCSSVHSHVSGRGLARLDGAAAAVAPAGSSRLVPMGRAHRDRRPLLTRCRRRARGYAHRARWSTRGLRDRMLDRRRA